MINCSTLIAGMQRSCLGEKRPGGVDGVIYAGFRSDLASVTYDNTTGEITAFTLKEDAKLYKYGGKPQEHEIKATTIDKRVVKMYAITGDFFFYPYTQADVRVLEKIVQAEGMFFVYVTMGGQMKISGIDRNPWNAAELYDNRGFKAAIEWTEGKTIEADTFSKITMTGEFYELPKLYKTTATLAANIAEMDALAA